jgi:hypothetical protein
MPARTSSTRTQKAAARVGILARWRDADDPELLSARRALILARLEDRCADLTAELAAAGKQFRALDDAS